MDSRRERIFKHLDRNGFGLEIGASHSPLAPKREGFKTDTLDHLDREGLIRKYDGHGVDTELIEEVDYVWNGEAFSELTGYSDHYDWIIASHVIEHAPDLIGFLINCESVLKKDGVLSLAIPDKRYCFDHFRPISGLARVIECHDRCDTIHNEGLVAEYYLNVVSKGDQIGWEKGSSGAFRFVHSKEEMEKKRVKVREEGAFLDLHSWCFVPHSFRLIAQDLYDLGYIKLRELAFYPTEGCEFFVALSRCAEGAGLDRLEALKRIESEIKER